MIAEILAEPMNQWLAHYYLQVPPAMLKAVDSRAPVPSWYSEARIRFADPAGRQLRTHGEMALVVRCARYAWESSRTNEDDGVWLDILSDRWSAPGALKSEDGLRAFYEMFIYLLRGRERCGLEASIPTYIDAVISFNSLGLARDIECFASYLVSGAQGGIIKIARVETKALFKKLLSWVGDRVASAPGPVVLSELLIARGALVAPDYMVASDTPTTGFLEELATETLEWWTRALDTGEGLHLFPILELRELVNKKAPILCHSVSFDEFIERLDRVSANRVAGGALAATTRDRAISLLQAGKTLEALPPILAARRHWHNGDSIRMSLISSIIAVDCLIDLGLFWAAKRTIFDIVSMCERVGSKDNGDLLTSALFKLGLIECRLGDWATSVQSYAVALRLHNKFAADPYNVEKHECLTSGFFHLVNMVIAGEMVAPGFQEWALISAAEWDLDDDLARFRDDIRQNWRKAGIDGGDGAEDFPLSEAPLADVRPLRYARWSALGCQWIFSWPNDYDVEAAAIELLATIQIMLAGIAKRHKHLMPCSVRVDVRSWVEGEVPVEHVLGEPGINLIARMPIVDNAGDSAMNPRTIALVIATSILEMVSVDKDIANILPKLAGSLVGDAIFVGASPKEGREQIFPREVWQQIRSIRLGNDVVMRIAPQLCADLPFLQGVSPLYNAEESMSKNARRYDVAFKAAEPVLRAHGGNPEFKNLVGDLRAEGWLDWQIASAIAPAALSVHVGSRRTAQSSLDETERELRLGLESAYSGRYSAPEWSPVFVVAIRQTLIVGLFGAFAAWGLRTPQSVPDVDAVKRFLAERFHHFSDDIAAENRSTFPWEVG